MHSITVKGKINTLKTSKYRLYHVRNKNYAQMRTVTNSKDGRWLSRLVQELETFNNNKKPTANILCCDFTKETVINEILVTAD